MLTILAGLLSKLEMIEAEVPGIYKVLCGGSLSK